MRVMRLRTGAVVLLVCLLCVAGPAGLGRPARAQSMNYRLVNPGYLTVATHGTLPPEIVVGPGDQLGGVDGMLYNAFVKDHGLKLKLFQTTFASMILAVEQGKVDAGEGVFYTAERAKHVYYAYPFYVTHAFIATLPSFQYTGPASMDGKKVGTVIGYVWASYLQQWSPSGASLFPDEVSVSQALLNGQVQGYINGFERLGPGNTILEPPFNGKAVAHPLHPGDFGFPESVLANIAYNIVNCKNPGLAAAMNEEITKLHASGEWQKGLTANQLGPAADAPLKSPAQLCSGG
jgi:ABC-type amino acid transport substrate-binding protein